MFLIAENSLSICASVHGRATEPPYLDSKIFIINDASVQHLLLIRGITFMIQSTLFCARPAHIWSRCAFVDGCPAGFDWTRGGMEKVRKQISQSSPLARRVFVLQNILRKFHTRCITNKQHIRGSLISHQEYFDWQQCNIFIIAAEV